MHAVGLRRGSMGSNVLRVTPLQGSAAPLLCVPTLPSWLLKSHLRLTLKSVCPASPASAGGFTAHLLARILTYEHYCKSCGPAWGSTPIKRFQCSPGR